MAGAPAVAEFVESRVERGRSGFHWRATVGPREDYEPVDDNAFVNMAASRALDEATSCADLVGEVAPEVWADIARRLVVPTGSARDQSCNTPARPCASPRAVPPRVPPVSSRSGIARTPRSRKRRIGTRSRRRPLGMSARRRSPRSCRCLLPGRATAAPHGVCWTRATGSSCNCRSRDRRRLPAQKDRPRASPMFANMGGFLLALLYGFPGLRLGYGPVACLGRTRRHSASRLERDHVERIHARRCGWCLDVRHGHRASIDPWPQGRLRWVASGRVRRDLCRSRSTHDPECDRRK